MKTIPMSSSTLRRYGTKLTITQTRSFTNSPTPSWLNSTIGGGFTKDGLQQWAMLTDFGADTNLNGQQTRRRKRQLSDDPETLPYVDLFSQHISQQCSDYLVHQPSTSGLLGRAFFGSSSFMAEKYLLTAMNSVFSLYPDRALVLPAFHIDDRYLQWRVTMNASLELICSWELESYNVKGCTMVAFDPTLRKVYHGNCINVPAKRLEGNLFRHPMRMHLYYAKFLLNGMVNELESLSKSK